MTRIREAILVEGRYDVNTVRQVVDTLPAAAELVLSANYLSSGESMAQYAEAAGAQHIIIAASSEKGLRSHKGLDVQSTYKEGEIARQFKKE